MTPYQVTTTPFNQYPHRIIVRAEEEWSGEGTLVVALGEASLLTTLFNPSRHRIIVGAGEVWRGVGTLVVALGGVNRLMVAL